MGGLGFDFGLDPQTEESSRFFDLYSRLANSPGTDYSEFLDPQDPELLNYQRLATTPTGSERMISDYVERQPTYEDYKPSLGRKLAAFGIGALSGSPAGAYEMSRKILYDPYQQALSDWKGEGTNISSRARLMDAERQRELMAAKYGLQNKVSQLRATERNRKAQDASSRAVASGIMRENEQIRAEAERKREFDERIGLSKSIFGATESNRAIVNELAKERESRMANEAADRTAARAEEAGSFGKQNKRLFDFASQRGIDTSEYGSALDVAKELALQEAKKNRAWADIIEENPNADIRFSISRDPAHAERARLLQIYLNSLANKYMRGQF